MVGWRRVWAAETRGGRSVAIQSTEARSILVVEDDPDLATAIAEGLAAYGHRVAVARDGREALELLRLGVCPDVILLDLTMPHMDGLEFRAEQSRDARIADIPVVVMTAMESMALRAAASGLQNFLIKPLDLDHMIQAVGRWTAPARCAAAA
jgi:two-component system, chemotaxis family, chemotaxis protein CheY